MNGTDDYVSIEKSDVPADLDHVATRVRLVHDHVVPYVAVVELAHLLVELLLDRDRHLQSKDVVYRDRHHRRAVNIETEAGHLKDVGPAAVASL